MPFETAQSPGSRMNASTTFGASPRMPCSVFSGSRASFSATPTRRRDAAFPENGNASTPMMSRASVRVREQIRCLVEVDVSQDDEGHVVRPVMRLGERIDILLGDRRDALVGPANGARVRMARREDRRLHPRKDVADETGLVALAQLVSH